jgi:Flp pilus assembly protein TadG
MPQRSIEGIRKSREKGIAVYLTAFFLLAMIPIVGLAVDGGLAFVVRARLSAAADSAALAAGRGINLAGTVAQAQAQATAQATAFFNANFPSGYLNTSTVPSTRIITPTFTVNTDSGGNQTGVMTISMFVQVQAPTYFMRWLGVPSLTINDTGTATRKNLVLELVLDKSASMGTRDTPVGTQPASINASSSSCEAMVYSTLQFLKYFSPYDTLGEISFDATVYDDNNAGNDGSYAASQNYWESGASGMANSISYIQCGSNTNTTAGLYKAYQDIKAVNQKLAQNVIVLFTDGVPNGVNAVFPVRTKVDSRMSPAQGAASPGCGDATGKTLCTSGVAGAVACPGASGCVAGTASAGGSGTGGMGVCTSTAGTVTGVITQTNSFSVWGGSRGGLFPIYSTSATPTVPAGCSSASGQLVSSQTIAYIPNSDYFGNSTIALTSSTGSSVTSPWFQWIYGDTINPSDEVNYSCAPAGTPITSGNTACKNLGSSWTVSPYNTLGAGAPNNTFQGGPYMGFLRPDTPNSIGVASMTSATNMAFTIRSDTNYNPVIDAVYLQGNGTDPVDRAFLQIVTNQQNIQPVIYDSAAAPYTNPYYQSTQATGIWAATSSTLQLESMFQQIASSLLRISQ